VNGAFLVPAFKDGDRSVQVQPSFVALYFDRIRYSRNCRGLMRVKAIVRAHPVSVSKLILKLLEGLNQSPNNAACSLMSVSPVSSVAGETKEIEPSAFCAAIPGAVTPATSAHAPRGPHCSGS